MTKLNSLIVSLAFASLFCASSVRGDELSTLKEALTLHVSFENGLDAEFARGQKTCLRSDASVTVISPDAGRFGNAVQFTKKSLSGPIYDGRNILNYSPQAWNTSVSIWLRLDPDKDLEPGYCDPVQIVGGDAAKGFVFLEWSKDETPRFFRYAIRPLIEIWNPKMLKWDEIPAKERPMVQVERAPFQADQWTHVVFTLENVNDNARPQSGSLYLNGELAGTVKDWNLTFGWDPGNVRLVLGAAYIGFMDDLAVFDKPLTAGEVKALYQLENGVRDLYISPTSN
jgi:hypothetical protein